MARCGWRVAFSDLELTECVVASVPSLGKAANQVVATKLILAAVRYKLTTRSSDQASRLSPARHLNPRTTMWNLWILLRPPERPRSLRKHRLTSQRARRSGIRRHLSRNMYLPNRSMERSRRNRNPRDLCTFGDICSSEALRRWF